MTPSVRMEDVFHTGIVATDLEAACAEITALTGAAWTPVEAREMPLRGPDGPLRPTMRFTYTLTGPNRLEVLEAIPGTVWEAPAAGTMGPLAAHHVGIWCDDVAGASRRLAAAGSPLLVTYDGEGTDPVGFAYHRLQSGLLVELVDRSRRDGFERWFAGGPFPIGVPA